MYSITSRFCINVKMKSSPFHVILIYGLIFALFKTDTSSLKLLINNSVCDDQGQCKCKPGWYGDKCNYTNDCKLDVGDRNYRGNVSVTKSGFSCLFWNDDTYHKYFVMQHNYCRAPFGDNEVIPWCYIHDTRTSRYWEHCDIPKCVCEPGRFGENCENKCHCKTSGCDVINGHCYDPGCMDGWSGDSCDECEIGRFGNNCQHSCHCKTPGCAAISGNCKGGCSDGWKGDSCNECLPHRFGPNCEKSCHCQLEGCDNKTGVCFKSGCMQGWNGESCNYTSDCKVSYSDYNYRGTVNVTKNSLPCKPWKDAPKKYQHLPENYCRAPYFDKDTNGVPWCYTVSRHTSYETCNISICVCAPGYFGENCETRCHCVVDGCDVYSGVCYNQTAGCEVPWTGKNCSILFSCPDLNINSDDHLLNTKQATVYHINDTIGFLCDKGYTLSGPKTLTCVVSDRQTEGQWNGTKPICKLITCSKSFLNLTRSQIIGSDKEIYRFEDVVNISCKPGYTGISTLTKCFQRNNWTKIGPECKGVPCPDLNKTYNSELPKELNSYRFQDKVIFRCKKGYKLLGNASLICLANGPRPNGKWSGVQPACTAENSSEFPAAAVGAGVGSTIAVILISLTIVIIVVRRRKVEQRTPKHTVYKENSFEFGNCGEDKRSKTDLTSSINTESKVTTSRNNDGPYDNVEDGGYYSFTLDKQIPRSAILVKDFFDYVENGRDTEEKIELEFLKLKNGLQKATLAALKPGNKAKNKYKNMYAYDETRVILDVIEGSQNSDYINASFIHGYGQVRKYIASQGPLDHTVNDFWRMVWQCNCGKIVMLTNIFEEGKQKCIQYWPEGENQKAMFGGIEILLIKEEIYSDFVIRIIKMQKGTENKVVKHFHYTAWPDKNVPKYSSSLVHFRHKVNNTEVSCTGPMVVHCSAGIGRTGTYIGLDYVVNQAKEVDYVDVFGCVEGLRRQRVNMVQTQRQYVFLHDAVLEALMCPNSGIPSKDFQEDYKKLLEFDSIKKKLKLRVEYEMMNKISRRHDEEEFDKGKSVENKTKNRFSNIIPVGSEIPLLFTTVEGHNEYINAVFLPGYKNSKAFIVTQMPLEDTKVDLLRLVYDYNISSIVMLNQSYDRRDAYWPESGELSVTSGPFIIEQTNIETSRLFQLLQLKIVYKNKDHRNLKMFQAKFWGDIDVVPKTSSDIFSFIDVVENDCNSSGPVLVHCLNGCDKSGLYCVLATVIERLRIEQDVGIQHIIKQMRNMRPQIIPNYEQFQFIYEAVIEYLQDFETYSNFQ